MAKWMKNSDWIIWEVRLVKSIESRSLHGRRRDGGYGSSVDRKHSQNRARDPCAEAERSVELGFACAWPALGAGCGELRAGFSSRRGDFRRAGRAAVVAARAVDRRSVSRRITALADLGYAYRFYVEPPPTPVVTATLRFGDDRPEETVRLPGRDVPGPRMRHQRQLALANALLHGCPGGQATNG